MAGGLLNIISVGNNNVILTGNPTKTFFKVVYSKYTNFGLQKFRIDFDGQRDLRLTTPSTFTFRITRNAELLMDTYLVLTLPDIYSPIWQPDPSNNNNKWSPYDFKWIDNIGTNIISNVLITCGSQTIATYTGDYLAAMVNRDFDSEKKKLFDEMTGNTVELNDPANAFGRVNTYPSSYYTTNVAGAEPSIRGRNLYIPINTWFTLDSRCAFPLISLQYNELYFEVTLRPIQELFRVRDIFDFANNNPYIQPDFNQQQFQLYRYLQTPPSVNLSPESYENNISNWNADVHLLCTYCFLSKDEAKLFAKEDQVYLVKDVYVYNFQNITGTSKLDLTSTGMVSSWMWYLQRNDVNMRNEWSNYTNWPYKNLPGNIILAPQYDENNTIPYLKNIGPLLNPDDFNTGLFITGNFNSDNVKGILQTMGILLNGDYRENVLESGVFNYVEKYTRTKAFASDGLYCYNFCLNTSPFEYQPSGAINMSRFKDIQLEVSTFVPTINPAYSTFNLICDPNGNAIGIQKSSWRLYEYNFNLTLFEERYNILSFINGNAGMLYAR
jgi:hypothetical protein